MIVPQADLFTEINDAIEMFWTNIVNLGLENNVVLYTASDFGRTLTSNGSGSDHAWGGNHFIISGSANGGKFMENILYYQNLMILDEVEF